MYHIYYSISRIFSRTNVSYLIEMFEVSGNAHIRKSSEDTITVMLSISKVYIIYILCVLLYTDVCNIIFFISTYYVNYIDYCIPVHVEISYILSYIVYIFNSYINIHY